MAQRYFYSPKVIAPCRYTNAFAKIRILEIPCLWCRACLLYTSVAQLASYDTRSVALTLCRETLVELLSTIGRGIGLDLDVYLLVGYLISVVNDILPLLDLTLVELSSTNLSTVDEELEVGRVLLLDDCLLYPSRCV